MPAGALSAFRDIVGADHVITDKGILDAYNTDWLNINKGERFYLQMLS